jgi:16S rRNA (guanine527-N7)-methyltransferase
MTHLLETYFPGLTPLQLEKFARMEQLYREWNAKINVISRKDVDQLATHHILHSLSIAKILSFAPGTCIMDAGTGGGFPGIPLALMFPETHFTLVDSIGKKINVIDAIAGELQLGNVKTQNSRVEMLHEAFDFVTGRAVTRLPAFVSLVRNCIKTHGFNAMPNGVLYLTGGDVDPDLSGISAMSRTWALRDFFSEDYFSTKKLVHLHNFS